MSSIVLNPSGQPASPVEGEVYYDSTADKLKVRDASGFREVVSKNSSGEIDGTLSSSAVVPATVGGWKLLNRTAISGSPTYVEFINGTGGVVIDSSTYEMYQFRISGIGTTTGATNVSIQVGKSSGYLTSGGKYKIAGREQTSSGGNNARYASTFNHLPLGWVGGSNVSTGRSFVSTLDVSLKANHFSVFSYQTAQYQDTNVLALSIGGCIVMDTAYYGDDIDRFRFLWHNGYTSSSPGTVQTWQNEGSIALYGLKTS